MESAPSPRIIKTHLPMSMLPPNLLEVSKVVVVARNVMDVCVSFFHMDKMTQGLGLTEDGCFNDYVDFFISGKPSIYGNYWTHLKVDILTMGRYSPKGGFILYIIKPIVLICQILPIPIGRIKLQGPSKSQNHLV